jgi:hypothetical protein
MKESTKAQVKKALAKEMNCTAKQIILLESTGDVEGNYGYENFYFSVHYSNYCNLGFEAVVNKISTFNGKTQKFIKRYTVLPFPKRAEAYDGDYYNQ